MTATLVKSVTDSSRCLLAAIRSGEQDQLIPELVNSRGAALDTLGAVLESGAKLSPEEIQQLAQLDRELIAAISQRREQIGADLTALRRRRLAGMAYRNQPGDRARFVDRES